MKNRNADTTERLRELERVIAPRMRSFLKVAKVLKEIQDNRLYPESHATFEEYCQRRWGIGRRTKTQAHRMSRPSLSIDAATAYHEAGHAVVACCLGLRVRRATIAPDGDSAGHVMIEREKPSTCAAILRGELWHRSRLSLEKRVMQLQAGEVAQWQYNPRSVRLRHSQNDFNRCVELLRKYDPDQEKPDSKLHRMLLDKWTHSLIERHWHFVKAVANALLARRELSGTQLRDVIRAANQKQGARMPLPAKKKASRKG